MSSPAAPELARLAASIAASLCEGADACVRGSVAETGAIVREALAANFRTEEAIHREAEAALRDLGASASGMDHGKLLIGLRERIAKGKRFVL